MDICVGGSWECWCRESRSHSKRDHGDAGELAPAFTCRVSEDKDTDQGTSFASRCQSTNQHICPNNHRDHHGNLTSDYNEPAKFIPAIRKDSKRHLSTDSILLAGIVGHITHIQRFSLTFIDLTLTFSISYVTLDENTCHPVTFDQSRHFGSVLMDFNFRPAYLPDTCSKVPRWMAKGQV
jgi:hypothetical protein